MIQWLMRRWRSLQRSTDMTTLWPACKQNAPSLDHAKAAFYLHISNDPAWTRDFTREQLESFIDDLT